MQGIHWWLVDYMLKGLVMQKICAYHAIIMIKYIEVMTKWHHLADIFKSIFFENVKISRKDFTEDCSLGLN